MTNHLSTSTSPYLLQHAHNPVDWYPWSEEALAKARIENRPIFLSIGYAACHWCHVMAHESFEDESTATLMNENFINIKVDREERPDLDSIYMQAVMALTGGGGWPMSVFLTPELHPFYGGTYFPPVPRHNLPAFRDVLTSITEAWKRRRDEIDRVGAQLVQHIQSQSTTKASAGFTSEHLALAEKNLIDSYDWGYGGWGGAPKFPQPMTVEFLLAYSALTPTPSPNPGRGEQAALHALKVMARGGMYDVVGGGFSRYSTDNFWRVPHFEKMLYDNAQLIRTYLHAYQITGEPFFRRIVEETLDFIAREMTHPDGGFYSSLDADSEGDEGKFYVWTKEEIRAQLADSSDFFETAYGITEKGNWEGKTVLQRALDDTSLAARFNLTEEAVAAKLADCHRQLLTTRSGLVRPGTDDKILTSWNGLMLAALAEAARVLPNKGETILPSILRLRDGDHVPPLRNVELNDEYYNLATRSAEFLLTHLRPDGKLRRAWRDGKTSNEVFLEDYAALILGLLELYQTDFDNKWFTSAMELAEEMIQRFRDPSGGFFDTPADGESLLVRPKDLQDNATPSGNALATEALLKLAALTGRGDLRDLAETALRQVTEFAVRYPTAFGRWLSAAEFAQAKVKQVAIIVSGDGQESARELVNAVRAGYRPNVMVAAALHPIQENAPELLRDRPLVDGKSAAYVCEGFVCLRPVTTADELEKLL
jgi:uncharacterized protein YyaL (SSP411 family)